MCEPLDVRELRAARAYAGVTQMELCAITGWSRGMVSLFETGKTPLHETFLPIWRDACDRAAAAQVSPPRSPRIA